jgi:hypothetical protein
MNEKVFKISLLAFKPSGKYYSEYNLEGSLQYWQRKFILPLYAYPNLLHRWYQMAPGKWKMLLVNRPNRIISNYKIQSR